MVTHAKSHIDIYRKKLLLCSLLMFMLMFSLFSYVGGVEVSFLNDVVYVNSEKELEAVVNNAMSGVPVVIALNRDITLSNILVIADQDITLISNSVDGFYRLIGAVKDRYAPVISVKDGGVLRLDGISITHTRDIYGYGVSVLDGGALIMLNGKISGNNIPDSHMGSDYFKGCGGGVTNFGVFEMFNGEISSNKAGIAGGGVYNHGNFTMHGGIISNNKADQNGGGVMNFGVFEMFNGEISSNKAGIAGGGVYNGGTFIMHSGKILSNSANQSGGGVYNYEYSTFNKLGGKISDNISLEGNNIYPLENNAIENGKLYNNGWLSNAVICACIILIVIVGVLFLYFKRQR